MRILAIGLILFCMCVGLDGAEVEDELRLPKFAVPKHYNIRLQPDLDHLSFNGFVEIEVEIVEKTERLILNAVGLDIARKSIYFRAEHKRLLRPVKMDMAARSERTALDFGKGLPVGVGVLGMKFFGNVSSEMEGLFNRTYTINGEERNMLATQFESAFARRCFPCWDEPAFKATFTVTVDIPSHLMALSNMPVVDEKITGLVKTVYFQKSPLMSTYLVAVVIGQFDHIERHTSDGIKVRVYCPIGRTSEAVYALKLGTQTLDFYKKYLSMPFALPKLDMVAIPAFPLGMENYGLIIFGESQILINNQSSMLDAQKLVADHVTHELAHQWFGNLVTIEWWSDLWLNEAFATWLSYKAVDSLYPEWDAWFGFITYTESTLLEDASADTHPVVVRINNISEIDNYFDDVVYYKGAHIIRMLNEYLGPETFQRSLKVYVRKHAWSNTKTDDLWAVLKEVSGLPVSYVMDTWVKKRGFPVVSVNVNLDVLELRQSQLGAPDRDQQWVIPIRLCCGAYDTCHNIILQRKHDSFDLRKLDNCACTTHSTARNVACPWRKINLNRTGFYRVVYQDSLVSDLQSAVVSKQFSTSDRYALLTDSYQLLEAPRQTLTYMLSLMSGYREEDDKNIMNEFIRRSIEIVKITYDATAPQVGCIKKIFSEILENYAKNVGWDAKQEETSIDRLVRLRVLYALARMGHKRTQNEAKRRFHAFLVNRNTSLFPYDIRWAAYVAVVQTVNSSNSSDFNSLLDILKDLKDGDWDKHVIQVALTSSPAPAILFESLKFLFSHKVLKRLGPPEDLEISWGGREVAWTWFKENWGTLDVDISIYIDDILDPFTSSEKAAEAKDFFAHRLLSPVNKMHLKHSIDQLLMRATWVKSIQKERNLPSVINNLSQGRC